MRNKINRPKIPIDINNAKYVLVREKDGLVKKGNDIKWLEWNEDGTHKQSYEEPAIGRSLLIHPFGPNFTWLTTTITEIIEQREHYIKFRTQNSVYELTKNIDNETQSY
jgi:hypothetical protein